MIRNILSYIFIYTFIVGCDTTIYTPVGCTECTIQLSVPDLNKDSNGYYHLNWLDGNVQIFTRVEANVGHSYEYVGWTSDTYFDGCVYGYCEPISIVNESSYSDMDGIAYTLIGVYEDNIGDTAMVYCGYYRMGKQYLDSLGVIIDE